MQYKTEPCQIDDWDYFCELVAVIPGLAEVFNDYQPGDTRELHYKERRESGKETESALVS